MGWLSAGPLYISPLKVVTVSGNIHQSTCFPHQLQNNVYRTPKMHQWEGCVSLDEGWCPHRRGEDNLPKFWKALSCSRCVSAVEIKMYLYKITACSSYLNMFQISLRMPTDRWDFAGLQKNIYSNYTFFFFISCGLWSTGSCIDFPVHKCRVRFRLWNFPCGLCMFGVWVSSRSSSFPKHARQVNGLWSWF